MTWTVERVEIVKRLWQEGLSARHIAAEIGGVTRNAVIGIVHRQKLTGRSRPAETVVKSRRPKRPPPLVPNYGVPRADAPRIAPRPIVEPNLPAQAPAPLMVPILELTEATCKWPIGDPGTSDFGFCGHLARLDRSYCEHHARVAYQPVDRRRDRKLVSEIAA